MSPRHGPTPCIGIICGRHTAIGDRRGDGVHIIGAGDTPTTDLGGVGVIRIIPTIPITRITYRVTVLPIGPTIAPLLRNGRLTVPAGGALAAPAPAPVLPGHRAPTATASSPTLKTNGYVWATRPGHRNDKVRPDKSKPNATTITAVTRRATTAIPREEAASAAEAAVRREAVSVAAAVEEPAEAAAAADNQRERTNWNLMNLSLSSWIR